MNNNILNNQNYIVSEEIKIDLFLKRYIIPNFVLTHLKLLIKSLLKKATYNNLNKLKYIFNLIIFLVILPLLYFFPKLFIIYILSYVSLSLLFSKVLNSYIKSNLIVLWFKNNDISSINKESIDYQPIYYLNYREKIIMKDIKEIKSKMI